MSGNDEFPSMLVRREPTLTFARRSGKTDAMAREVAEALRNGQAVYLVDHANKTVKRVVGVPGYPDGTQLTDG